MARLVLERLRRKFGDAIVDVHNQHGNETAVVERDALLEIARFLKGDSELAFDMPIDCTCVDWYERRDVRFDVIWHFYSVEKKHRVRIKVRVPEEEPTVPSLTPLWPGFNWHERETWDLYGIRFSGHPNLKRVLLYEEFVGHPLRKDYPIDARQPLIPMRPVAGTPTQRVPPAELLNEP